MRRDVFQAIADPTRREILGILSSQPLNVNEITGNFPVSRTAVSKHMKILQECGLLVVEKKGRERFCHARLESLLEVSDWINQYARFWNKSLDKLEELLRDEDLKKRQNKQ